MTTDKEFIKELIRGKIKQRVYTLSDIADIFEDIGLKISEFSLRDNLREHAINPNELGIDSTRFGYNKKIVFYSEDAVWNYLKELENKGRTDLEALGIKNFEELLKRKNTMKDHYIKGRIIRKHILDD